MTLVIRNARAVTLAAGPRPRRGAAIGALDVVDAADIVIEGDSISQVARSGHADRSPRDADEVDAEGRVIMPGFVDCHTHACWAGDRVEEWEMRLRGATYLELLDSGGGIMSTVRAVRAATREQLADLLLKRLDWMLREGTTTAEVKSGYGLSTEHELKMLGAIHDAAARWPGTAVATACIGHAIDPDVEHAAFVDRTIDETLPAVHEAYPGVAVDAYCETGAWSLDDCIRLFERAHELGHPIRVHADQFNALGMTPAAIHLGARSVDHLEAARPHELTALAEAGAFGVMLPCSGFHVDGRYADGRAFLDAGGALCIATNLNPGSAPCVSMPMAIALAARRLGVTTAEAIGACTVNAAALLGLDDRGAIAAGQRADLVLLRHTDERRLGHDFGGNPVWMTICAGRVVA